MQSERGSKALPEERRRGAGAAGKTESRFVAVTERRWQAESTSVCVEVSRFEPPPRWRTRNAGSGTVRSHMGDA